MFTFFIFLSIGSNENIIITYLLLLRCLVFFLLDAIFYGIQSVEKVWMAMTNKVLDFASKDNALVFGLVSDQRCLQGIAEALINRKSICLVHISPLHPLDEQPYENI